MHHNHASRSPRRIASIVAVGIVSVAGFAACGDDDDTPDETEVETVTSDVTTESEVTVDSEVTLGTTVSSEVEVTDIETDVSEVEVGGPVTTG
jgi:hypothetical protein